MKSNLIIIVLFFCALVGVNYPVITGVSWADLFVVPLFIYVILNLKSIKINNDIIAYTSIIYAIIMLISALINATITDTIFLNFFRNYIEGCIAYLALKRAINNERDFKIFSYIAILYCVLYIFMISRSFSTIIGGGGKFSSLNSEIYGGRNGMAVTNLLLIILLSYIVYFWRTTKSYIVFLLFPFLIFNIIFSASRFSVISLALFVLFFVIFMTKEIKTIHKMGLIIIIIAIPFFVEHLTSNMDVDAMMYSSELLNDKITQNEDGGFMYRLNNLNYKVIVNWLDNTPVYKWILGDGISITHGVFAFTFCCTGIVGFFYFLVSHIKMIILVWKKSLIGKYLAFFIFIFFLNDIVTNSRFIIGLNTLIYMGMLALMSNTIVLKIQERRKWTQ